MISASEDRFTTDVSSNIQIYLKESHPYFSLIALKLNEIEKSIGNDPRNHWRKARKATMDWIR